MDILQLEQFCFDIVNQLSDEYGIHDDGSVTRAIWDANTIEKMEKILNFLQSCLLDVMQNSE